MTNIAMENAPFIDGLPITNGGSFHGYVSHRCYVYHRVPLRSVFLGTTKHRSVRRLCSATRWNSKIAKLCGGSPKAALAGEQQLTNEFWVEEKHVAALNPVYKIS